LLSKALKLTRWDSSLHSQRMPTMSCDSISAQRVSCLGQTRLGRTPSLMHPHWLYESHWTELILWCSEWFFFFFRMLVFCLLLDWNTTLIANANRKWDCVFS
jgi:hypothetical protein